MTGKVFLCWVELVSLGDCSVFVTSKYYSTCKEIEDTTYRQWMPILDNSMTFAHEKALLDSFWKIAGIFYKYYWVYSEVLPHQFS